jgi:hypothetical protein
MTYYNWSGRYIGGNGGGVWVREDYAGQPSGNTSKIGTRGQS